MKKRIEEKGSFGEGFSNKLIVFILLIVILVGAVSLAVYLKMPTVKSTFTASFSASTPEAPAVIQGQASINVLPTPKESQAASDLEEN